jgi:hypothetical protein
MIIFGWCKPDVKLDWMQVSPFFKNYSRDNGRMFKDQSSEWKEAFARHVDRFGFYYARLDRDDP